MLIRGHCWCDWDLWLLYPAGNVGIARDGTGRESKQGAAVVFLSQESSAGVGEEALSTGACAYVVKAKAATQLLAVLDVVILQRRFVTTS
jgi:AmiR/NasT family two-component response regulator